MKYKEIDRLGIEELRSKVADEVEVLRKHRFAHSISPIDNPMTIRKTRRSIARLKTNMRKKILDSQQQQEDQNVKKS